MESKNQVKLNIVDQYLQVSCFNKISQSTLDEIMDYEVKADHLEKKLIRKIKEQVKNGKIALSIGDVRKTGYR